MTTFRVRLRTAEEPSQPRQTFDLEKLRNPDVICNRRIEMAPLIGLRDDGMDIDTMITTYNTAMTGEASEKLGIECLRKQPWITNDVLDVYDERKDLKKRRYEAEGAKAYMEAIKRLQKAVKRATEDWIGVQGEGIEPCLNKNNGKIAYQLVKDLTSEKQGRSLTIQDSSGKCLEKNERFSAGRQVRIKQS